MSHVIHGYCQVILVLGSVLVASWASAEQAASAQAASARVADDQFVRPFITETTFLIVKFDAHRMLRSDQGDHVGLLSPNERTALEQLPMSLRDPGALDRMVQQFESHCATLRDLTGDEPLFAAIGMPIGKGDMPITVFTRKPTGNSAEKLSNWLSETLNFTAEIRGEYLIAIPRGTAVNATWRSEPAPERHEVVASALNSTSDYPLQILLLPPDHAWRTVRELFPELPNQWGGGPSSVITDGIQWAAWGVDPGKRTSRLVIQSNSPSAAEGLVSRLPALLRLSHPGAAHIRDMVPAPLLRVFLQSLQPEVAGSQVILALGDSQSTRLDVTRFLPVARWLETQTRQQIDQRLKRILLALHNFHDTYGMFPPADVHRHEDGRPRLSWRVHILPFLGEEALYRQFRLDEPWDSPHNQQLIPKMPDVFSHSPFSLAEQSPLKPGHATLLAPVGEDTVLGGDRSTKLAQIQDGTSNTILIVEVVPERAVPWTSPEDFRFDPRDPLVGVRIGADGRWKAGFADGSVATLSSEGRPETVLHLFQKSDGQRVSRSDLE